jgi:hypothetical protein
MKRLAAVSLTTILVLATAAAPATALSSVPWGSGGTVRAQFYEHAGFGGAVATAFGSSNCTATTGDVDNYFSEAGTLGAWSNEISSSKDLNGCDTKIYDAGNGTGQAYGYFNAGTTGIDYSAVSWNDRTSSIRLS